MTALGTRASRKRAAPETADVVDLRPDVTPTTAMRHGGPTSEEVVELYKLLYTADRPLGFEDIVDQLPSAYRSHAYRQYRDAQTAEGVPIKEDKWTDREKDYAWRWWVGQLLDTTRQSKRIVATGPDGSRPTSKRRDQLFLHREPEQAADGGRASCRKPTRAVDSDDR